jgi:hypothetical protein
MQDSKAQGRQRAIDLHALDNGFQIDWNSSQDMSPDFLSRVEHWIRANMDEPRGFYDLEMAFPGNYAEGKWERRGPLIVALESLVLQGKYVDKIRDMCQKHASPSEVTRLVDRTLEEYTLMARRSFITSDD